MVCSCFDGNVLGGTLGYGAAYALRAFMESHHGKFPVKATVMGFAIGALVGSSTGAGFGVVIGGILGAVIGLASVSVSASSPDASGHHSPAQPVASEANLSVV